MISLRISHENLLTQLRQLANEPESLISDMSNRDLLAEINRLLKHLNCEQWTLMELIDMEMKLNLEKKITLK